jgi:hypothetical protein
VQFAITITLDVPDGTQVAVVDEAEQLRPDCDDDETEVASYWRWYLSDNGRKIYGAASDIEEQHGPGYSFEDIAVAMDVGYETTKSFHRTSGRAAKLWKKDNGTDEPIRLDSLEYEEDAGHGGMRTSYQLPDGVASEIQQLKATG